jgi:DNA-binding transcriptional regulator YhcF (GntR family)
VARAAPHRRTKRRAVDVILEIDPRSAVPPYEQLRQQVTALVLGGALAPGARLPAIRQLANDLGLAGGTVARAYRELESDGVVTTHGRHGTVVAGPPREPAPPAALLDAARRYAAQASTSGATLDDALTAVRVAFASEKAA